MDELEIDVGDGRILEPEVLRLRPEVMRCTRRFRCDGVEVARRDALAAIAFARAGAGFGRADVEAHHRRRCEFEIHPSIHAIVFLETRQQSKVRRRGRIENPAIDLDRIAMALGFHRNLVGRNRGVRK